MRKLLVLLVLAGCHSAPAASDARVAPDASTEDGGLDASAFDAGAIDAGAIDAGAIDTGVLVDAGPVTATRCPTSGRGAIVGDECFVLTPVETGLAATGAGADVPQYALRPTSGARGQLLLFLNGSGGSPAGGIATAETSWYSVARDEGLHVLGVSYRSDDVVGILCRGEDACFLPTRESILDGEFHTGAADELSDITTDEGFYTRVRAALVFLALHDPSGGWDAFFDAAVADPAASIRWDHVLTSGHSQGGGHAALLGRRHALVRAVMLSSPCDATTGPASWQSGPSGFATDTTTRFFGFAASDDGICSAHAAIWTALGMPASSQNDDAIACAASMGPHGHSIRCAENAATWARLLAE